MKRSGWAKSFGAPLYAWRGKCGRTADGERADVTGPVRRPHVPPTQSARTLLGLSLEMLCHAQLIHHSAACIGRLCPRAIGDLSSAFARRQQQQRNHLVAKHIQTSNQSLLTWSHLHRLIHSAKKRMRWAAIKRRWAAAGKYSVYDVFPQLHIQPQTAADTHRKRDKGDCCPPDLTPPTNGRPKTDMDVFRPCS